MMRRGAAKRHGVMVALACWLLAASLASMPTGAAAQTGPPVEGPAHFIVGGTNSPPDVLTAATALVLVDLSPNIARCTGTLIAPTKLLTAAHCVVEAGTTTLIDPTLFGVWVGFDDFDDMTVQNRLDVSSIAVHPSYGTVVADSYGGVTGDSNNPFILDAAILELSTPVAAGAIPVASSQLSAQAGTPVNVVGWGTTDLEAPIGTFEPRTPQRASMRIGVSPDCELQDRPGGISYDPRRSICLDPVLGSACFGDSGGPVFAPDPLVGWVVTGVVSTGSSACSGFEPVTAVRADTLSSWIRDVAGGGAVAAPRTETFHALSPSRIVDSRERLSSSGSPTGRFPGVDIANPGLEFDGSLRAGHTMLVGLAGRPGYPATGIASVAGTLTITDPEGPGFATVYPCAEGRPATSSINFVEGQTVANQAILGVDLNGDTCIYVSASAHVIVDAAGWFGDGVAGATFSPEDPRRLLDTRDTTSIGAGGTRELRLLEADGSQLSAAAVSLTVTATNTANNGFVTVWPCGQPVSTTSVLNHVAGQTTANSVIVPTGNGRLCMFTLSAADIIIDIGGRFDAGNAGAGAAAAPSPQRLLDTRGVPGGRLPARGVSMIQVTGNGGVPANATAATLNVTAVDTALPGYLTVFPCGERPVASNLNYRGDETVAGSLLAKLDASGRVCIYSHEPADIIVDVGGWFVPRS